MGSAVPIGAIRGNVASVQPPFQRIDQPVRSVAMLARRAAEGVSQFGDVVGVHQP